MAAGAVLAFLHPPAAFDAAYRAATVRSTPST